MPRTFKLTSDSGRQDAQTPTRDDTSQDVEEYYPSRINCGRLSLRISKEKLLFYKQWCRNQPLMNGREMALNQAMELAMDRLTGRLDAQTPSGVCVLDPDPENKTPEKDHSSLSGNTHTHQTHAGRQDVQPPLDGMRGPRPTQQQLRQKSQFSLEENLEYALDAHNNDRGIRNPDAWAAANFRTGKYDPLVKIWKAGQQQEQVEWRTCKTCKRRFVPQSGRSVNYCNPQCYGGG